MRVNWQGASAIKKVQKEDSWKIWATPISTGAFSGSVFYEWHPWAATLAFGQGLCLMAWIVKHMSIVSAT